MDGSISWRRTAGIWGVVAMTVALAGCSSIEASSKWGERPFLRSQVDADRGRIWVLTPAGVTLYETSTGEQIAEIPLPEWIWVGEKFACSPDLAIGPGGEAVVSSNVVPTLWRVDPVTLAASKHDLAIEEDAGKDIGITALAYSAQHAAYFAASPSQGSLLRIDPSLRTAQLVSLSRPLASACGLATPSRAPDIERSKQS